MSDHAETSRLEVLRQYQAAREQFRLCIAAILDPIEVRLNEFPENAFTELYTDNVALDEALAKSKEADGILTRLKRLVTQAAYHRIEVEPVETLDGQCEQINLKLELAWALNQRELRSAIEKAQSWMKSHPIDGIFQVLLEQANARLKKVASAAALVNSTEQRAEALQELMASLNEMDSAPIGDLLEIKKSFDDILEMNQSLQRYQVTEILDERDIDDQGKAKYRTLPELSKQREDIRETVRTVIKVFSDKVDRFIVHDPKVAADWFMPIKLFQEYLHPEQDASQLAENEVMCSTIEQNCGKWDQAEALLTQVDSLLDPARLPTTCQDKTLWDVCDLVRSAEENYSYHIGIDKRAATCILKIEEVMAREMSRWQEGCEVNLATQESGLVREPDWDGEWLQAANLPAWLTSDQKVLAVWQQQIDGFQQNLELHLGLAAQRQSELIEEAVGRLMECFQKQQTWQNKLVEKRLSIRAFIIQVQGLIRQGSQDHQQGLYQEAQNLYLDYVSQHAEWRADVELEKVKQLLADFLSDSQKLKNACLAYLAGQWSECITDCHSYSKSLPVLPLGAHIQPANWLSQLQNGQDENIPATEIDEVARILLQLANVMLATQEIERCYSEALYAEMGPHLDNIELYGQGESPLVAERKTQIQFDTCKQEYHVRLAFGDNHYLPEGSINQQANVILVESKKLLAAPASEAAWLADVQRTLSSLVSLDPEQASLWVGDIRNWQVALSNQFVRELDPYLSKIAATISQQNTQDVEQAFGFLQTARRYDLYERLRLADRRTIIFQNYLVLENRLHGQFQPIAQNWRHAVEEFPDDLAILEKFRSVIWAWWLSEIDQALLKAARGEDQTANLKHLFEQNAAFYPDLFRPIQTLAGYEVKTGLDAFHKEIKLRQTSLSVMEQADLNLSIKADNLALVLNDLRAAKNKLKRTELDEKIKTLAAGFTEDEVKLASDYIMHDQRIEAVEHYLRAYSLGAWEEGENWLTVPRTKGDVTAYWEKLRTDIDGFQEKSGDIYQQRAIARQYAIRIEELRACNQTWAQKKINWIPLSQIDSTNSKLIEKLKLLEWGIDNINHFMPLDDLWKAAVNPAILSKIAANPVESFSSVTSSWGQLERYLRGLKSQLGVTHTQVVSLSNWLDRFQKAVVALYQGVGTLRDDLLSTEDYKACLEVCRKINDNTLRLIEWEPQYFDLWESWRGKDLRQKFTNFYPNQATVYEAVKYKHGELTLRYFIEGEAFYTWQKDLNTYILVASTNVSPLPQQDVLNEVVYTFDEIRFNLYNGLHQDLYQTLRVELEQGGIFLGRFLVLAYIDKVLWDKEIDAFDQKVEASRALERIVGNNNPNKLTAMRTEIFYLAMQSWIVSLENRLNGSMPIAESSQSERVRIAQAVQIGNSLVPEGELQTRLKLMQQRVDYICRAEDNALNRFYSDLNDVNRTSLTGDSLENVTTLKRFYEYSPLNQPTQDLYKKMGIASEKLMAIDTDYSNNYKRLHEFLVYCEEVVQDRKL